MAHGGDVIEEPPSGDPKRTVLPSAPRCRVADREPADHTAAESVIGIPLPS